MTAFIRKEFRSLAPPAGLVLAAALVGAWGSTGLSHGWAPVAGQVAGIAFLVGTPLIAALSFGDEFHHRTMILLLSEPVSRARVWLDKWLVVVTVLGVLTGIELVVLSIQARGELSLVSAAMYVVMVVCSAPLWTLVARSTIGGLVFTGSVIMMLELGANYVSYRLAGTSQDQGVFGHTPALQAVRAAYSLAALWLGWLVFARFQAVGPGFGAASASSAGWTFLRSRPGQAIGNLARKELMLQRPTFLVAFLFSACWLATTAFMYLQLSSVRFAEVTFAVLVFVTVPLVVLLAGTISIGEETTHGTRDWHLTLPISTRVQWIVKLCVTLVVGLVLAIGLPWALAMLATAARLIEGDNVPVALIYPMFLVTGALVLAFWAATLAGHTVRAAVLTGLALLALSLVTQMGTRWGSSWGIGTGLVTDLMVRLQLPPDYFARPALMTWAPAPFAVTMFAAALWQSLSAFRRARTDARTTTRYTLTLLAIALVVTTSTSSFLAASRDQYSARPMQELRTGLQALSTPQWAGPASGPRQVTLAELARVSQLSSATQQWLANTGISIDPLVKWQPKGRAAYRATLQFPGRREFAFVYFVQ